MLYGRVSEADQVAFKAEAKILRKQLKELREERWSLPMDLLFVEMVWALRHRLKLIVERLNYWHSVLTLGDHRIRSPVRLWDSWNKLRMEANQEVTGLNYLYEKC
jgi:hypothetical protein